VNLGAAYFQAHRFQEAESQLKDAYQRSTDVLERAVIANDLGNLSANQGRSAEAGDYYQEAREKGAANPVIAVSAGLNLARLTISDKRLDALMQLSKEVEQISDSQERGRYFLNLGSQARLLGAPAVQLAYESLDRTRVLAAERNDRLLLAEALAALSQLYEDQGRAADALKLTAQAMASLPSTSAPELLIQLQWRRGRLLRQQGDDDRALRAYQSAVEQIENIRQDIPIEYVDGRSSFRETLEPIYLGLADLLLEKAAKASGEDAAPVLRQARNTVELIKQTELQDYLGNRCTVENTNPLHGRLLPHKAVFYPVILENRLELLLETQLGIKRRRVEIAGTALREKALGFAKSVREARLDYLPRARELYDLLLRPFEPVFKQEQIDTIVVVPDGPLRLVPVGALHDGERFAIERFAVAVAPGLTVTRAIRSDKESDRLLLAGLSEPGPVLEKLPKHIVDEFGSEEASADVRSAKLKGKLALPGVKTEIETLKRNTRSDALLDSEFTVDRFRRGVMSGKYSVLHIASHAMFGSSAQTSFVMAYDDILTIDDLEKLLRSQASPIELLTLSACQTAEGDDRAPLGIAGAALKARAGSALGSLWPVADEATQALMIHFYESFSRKREPTATALQRAQIELIHHPSFGHPFFWAPFVLVGSGL
jgi:CHAT domain-containing protein/predicted negative regulator of RcsB-dependent stress response